MRARRLGLGLGSDSGLKLGSDCTDDYRCIRMDSLLTMHTDGLTINDAYGWTHY